MELDSFLAELGINDAENTQQQPTVTMESIDSLLDSLNDLQQTIDTVSSEIHNDAPVNTEENSTSTEETQEVNSKPVLKPILTHIDDNARFSGAEWFDEIQNARTLIVGLGGIGSWLALLLSRLKVKELRCKDMDRVEEVNLAGQLYKNDDIGLFKAQAICDTIRNFNISRPLIYGDNREFTSDSVIDFDHNVFLALDSITARKTVYNKWKLSINSYYPTHPTILIDGRLTADKWQIFTIPSNDTKRMEVYENEWLFPESEAQHLPCSFKQTTYMAAMIASYMCNLFINFIAESTKPIVPYSVPFMTEFDAQTLTMTTYECS